MKSLKEHFETNDYIKTGTFLYHKEVDRLFVVSFAAAYEITLIDIITGEKCRHIGAKYESKPVEKELKVLLYDIPEDSRENIDGWQIMDGNNLVGKFATLLLRS